MIVDYNMNQNSEQVIPGVNCDVSNCVYNQNSMRCKAGNIKVGPGSVENQSQTICATFENSCK